MDPSGTDSFDVPSVLTAPRPIARAKVKATRVLVRNLGVTSIFLATESANLVPSISGETYELPGLTSDVLVLAPGQVLYARAAIGTTNRACVATSEAFPVGVTKAGA